jgi:hypothetical protein
METRGDDEMKTLAKILIHIWFILSLMITSFAAVANSDGWALLCFTLCCTWYGMIIGSLHLPSVAE